MLKSFSISTTSTKLMTWPRQNGRSFIPLKITVCMRETPYLLCVMLITMTKSHKTNFYGATVKGQFKRSKVKVKDNLSQTTDNALMKPKATSLILIAQTMTSWRNPNSLSSMLLSCLKRTGQWMSSMRLMIRTKMEICQLKNSESSTVPMFITRKNLSISTVQMTKSLTSTFASASL